MRNLKRNLATIALSAAMLFATDSEQPHSPSNKQNSEPTGEINLVATLNPPSIYVETIKGGIISYSGINFNAKRLNIYSYKISVWPRWNQPSLTLRYLKTIPLLP